MMPEWTPMDHITPDFLILGLGWYAVFLVAITCHEGAHAWAAKLLGDPTAYAAGQVTLNPAAHIAREPIGTIAMPILTYLLTGGMIGWASAPYDPYWALRHPQRALLMALAGPAANLVLVVVAGLTLRLGGSMGWFHETNPFMYLFGGAGFPAAASARLMVLAAIAFYLNLLLFVFNLIPLPPLDGSAIWPVVLRRGGLARYMELRSQPAFVLFGLIVAANVLPRFLAPVARVARQLLIGEF
jgi:Zn-dependent protease